MTRIVAQRTIDAPAADVFRTVSDIENLPSTNADILHIEFLTESRSGVGTRFRETRRMKSKEMVTELEVTEFDPHAHRVRMVTDSHGTVWDTLFTVVPATSGVTLTIDMDARAHAFIPKMLNPIMKGMFRRGIEKHLDTLKAHCEQQAAS